MQIKSKTAMNWSSRKKNEGIFFYLLFCPKTFFCVPLRIERFVTQSNFNTAQKMKFSIKDFFKKCDQILSFLILIDFVKKKEMPLDLQLHLLLKQLIHR